jgi:hypothetical protein
MASQNFQWRTTLYIKVAFTPDTHSAFQSSCISAVYSSSTQGFGYRICFCRQVKGMEEATRGVSDRANVKLTTCPRTFSSHIGSTAGSRNDVVFGTLSFDLAQ